jgi:3-hydroxypropanoate dehydrogenase
MTALPAPALDQLFGEARSLHSFDGRAIDDATIAKLYDLVRLGPTGFNAQPGRYVFVRSPEAKTRLAAVLSSGNRDKTLASPLTAIVAWDSRFPELLPERASGFFAARPETVESAGITNATLQAGYLIFAARALGLDAGPMSGFDAAALDAEFFPDGRWRSLLLVNLGYGDRSTLNPRAPRLDFTQAADIL